MATASGKQIVTDGLGQSVRTKMENIYYLYESNVFVQRKTRAIQAVKGWPVVLCNMLYCEQRPAANVRGGRDENGWHVDAALSPWRTSWRKWSAKRYTGTLGICVRKSLYSRSICLTAAKASDQSQPRNRQRGIPCRLREKLWGRTFPWVYR